jgi:hypothetical protein
MLHQIAWLRKSSKTLLRVEWGRCRSGHEVVVEAVARFHENFTKSRVTKRDPTKRVRLYQPFLSVALRSLNVACRVWSETAGHEPSMERVTVWCKTRRVRNSRGSVKNVRVSARLLSYLITIIPIPACLFAHHFYYIIVAWAGTMLDFKFKLGVSTYIPLGYLYRYIH